MKTITKLSFSVLVLLLSLNLSYGQKGIRPIDDCNLIDIHQPLNNPSLFNCTFSWHVKEDSGNTLNYQFTVKNLSNNQTEILAFGSGNNIFSTSFDYSNYAGGTYQVCLTLSVPNGSRTPCQETVCTTFTLQDDDGDNIPNECDNCPDDYNPSQTDSDNDGIGDACEDITVEGCEASVDDIWCNVNNGPNSATYPTLINSEVLLTNPFSNPASGYVRWNDAYLNGQQAAGGVFGNLAVGAQNLLFPSQFYVNISTQTTNWPSGFYVPMEVKYVDNVTGAECYVTLNPLITDPCDSIGQQRDHSEDGIKVYPNPTNSKSDIKFEGIDLNDINSIEVLDLRGNSKSKTNPSTNTLRLKNLAPGMYVIKFDTKDGVKLKKIIVE
ncbi:T9SS type A sorting domain-containing protein [uncultured Psychroserpens sp.]|uniref:T9SS type A sorting domain-containing protein n=1 Tax=uncultured Psychroserpens sp. TaxID=255436 RepID=UPI00345BC71E